MSKLRQPRQERAKRAPKTAPPTGFTIPEKERIDRSPLVAKTPRQKEYLAALRSHSQIFVTGSAGTGKTYLATAFAADELAAKRIDKIVLTRPNVPAGPSLGFFPGELAEKMRPWVVPFMETIQERLGKGQTEYLLKAGKIEIVPFEVMRGRTFKDAFVIVDESQNLSPNEFYMILTRIGEDSTLIVTGDTRQKDIKGVSGLTEAISKAKQHDIPVKIIEFGPEDVVRGGITAQWVRAWGNPT